VLKDPEGSGDLVVLDHQGEDLGAIVGALLGFDFGEQAGDRMRGEGAGDHAFGLSPADIEQVAAQLDPGHAAGFLLIEQVWARDLKHAIRDTGGVPVAEGFLTPEAVHAVEPELAAMADALNEIEAEDSAARDRKETQMGGLIAGRAAGRMQMRQGYRTMARMQRRRSFIQDRMGVRQDFEPAGQQAPAEAAPAEPGYMAELERLAQLRDQGVVPADEFEAKRSGNCSASEPA
jgi:hypothetical protein